MSARNDEEREMVAKARVIIQKRFDWWVDGDKRGLGQRGLTWFSKINTNNFHLIFEIIQNSDDASYSPSTPPWLTIDLNRPDLILFASNQIPFTEKNVIALCDAGQSSKIADKDTIGEKGLGFKSVFKICETVYIRSGGLSFSLHREGLGPVQPIWVEDDDFPIPMAELSFSKTYIVLKLGNSQILQPSHRSALRHKIRFLSPKIILFLRKLRHLRVISPDGSRDINKDGPTSAEPETVDLTVVENNGGPGPNVVRRSYIVHSYPLENMPEDDNRPGQTTSRMTLAFPCIKSKDLWIPISDEPGKIYAFLPLENTSFKFSVNADWVTSTNRETVDHDNDWNLCLRDHIASSFLKSMKVFVEKYPRDLRYSCLRWLPRSNAHKAAKTAERDLEFAEEFYRPAAWQIVQQLQQSACICTSEDKLAKPSTCVSIRSEFCHKGQPLLFSEGQSFAHRNYTEEDVPHLRTLGCMAFGKVHFVNAISHLADADLQDRFVEHGPAWFLSLFRALNNQARWSGKQLSTLQSLKIIPTSRGQLSKPEDSSLFFPSRSATDQRKFSSLDRDLVFVHSSLLTASNEIEKFLVAKLNTKLATATTMIGYIIELHHRASLQHTDRTMIEIKNQLSFLKSHENEEAFARADKSLIGVLDTGGQLKTLKTTLYDPSRKWQEVFGVSYGLCFIHQDLQDESILRFLVRCGLSTMPRLGCETLHLILNDEEKVMELLDIFRTYLVSDPLQALKDSGSTGSKTLDLFLHDKEFCDHLGNLKATCSDGSKRPLKDTLFPSQALRNENEAKLVIDACHERAYRKLLTKCGVRFDLDVNHRLRVLENLSQQGSRDLIVIRDAYTALEKECRRMGVGQASRAVREAFEQFALIYDPMSAKWLRLEKKGIFWNISDSLCSPLLDTSDLLLLSRSYEARKVLFSQYLAIPSFKLEDTKLLLPSILPSSGMLTASQKSALEYLLNGYCQFLEKFDADPDVDRDWLRRIVEFPIFLMNDRAYANDGNLIFPDLHELGTKFRGRDVQLLDIKEEDIPQRRILCQFVNRCQSANPVRFLSQCISRTARYQGTPNLNDSATLDLRNHVSDIIRYIYSVDGLDVATESWQLLKGCAIFEVESVHEYISLDIAGHPKVELDPVTVNCMFESDEKGLSIFLGSESFDPCKSIENRVRMISNIHAYMKRADTFREFLLCIWNTDRPAVEQYLRSRSIGPLPDVLSIEMRSLHPEFAESVREMNSSSSAPEVGDPSDDATIKEERDEEYQTVDTELEQNERDLVSEATPLVAHVSDYDFAHAIRAGLQKDPSEGIDDVVRHREGSVEDSADIEDERMPIPRAADDDEEEEEEGIAELNLNAGSSIFAHSFENVPHVSDVFNEEDTPPDTGEARVGMIQSMDEVSFSMDGGNPDGRNHDVQHEPEPETVSDEQSAEERPSKRPRHNSPSSTEENLRRIKMLAGESLVFLDSQVLEIGASTYETLRRRLKEIQELSMIDSQCSAPQVSQ